MGAEPVVALWFLACSVSLLAGIAFGLARAKPVTILWVALLCHLSVGMVILLAFRGGLLKFVAALTLSLILFTAFGYGVGRALSCFLAHMRRTRDKVGKMPSCTWP